MSSALSQISQCTLALADGSRSVVAAADEEAAAILSHLGDAMQLSVTSSFEPLPAAGSGQDGTGVVSSFSHGSERRFLIVVEARGPATAPAMYHRPDAWQDAGLSVCRLRSYAHKVGLCLQLMELSSILAHDAQTRGGVLLHGALAVRDGSGVILAAASGTGKTTASRRLFAPWCSLSDDAALVVLGPQGDYWAHPWPTWSRFQQGVDGGSWNVQKAVPLEAIFFLSQAVEDRAESVGAGHAVSLLVECAEQASQLMARGMSKEGLRALRLERFSTLCALARAVPTFLLHITRNGAFWREVEQTLADPGGGRAGAGGRG